MAGNDIDPWDRHVEESSAAFAAFAAYRDMGPARSITRVARELTKSRALMARWSSAHAWVLRAQAWDREQDRVFLAEQTVARREAARRHVKIAQAFLGKAIARLQSLDARELSPDQLLRYFQVAAEIERKVLAPDGTTPPDADADNVLQAGEMSDEERRARMEQLRRELERRIGEMPEEKA
ncbi:hypothetical protein [Streptomyces sp. NPDC091278]|uniref:hypothetical protein n=1 Tax=Streptomyces sp. NPDC091278 TaxID=3155301 RepID=UPI00344FB3D3